MNKKIILVVVLILIVATIVYLERRKVESSKEFNVTEIEIKDSVIAQQKALKYRKAAELVNPNGYLNSDNFTIAQYIGKKVILIDFWTYSCINCLRTLPYLNSWNEKYGQDGLLIIGVHSPEFDFEKDYNNVKMAVEKNGIKYPVVLDNEHLTWYAYINRFWPHKYLIDIDGFIVYDHIGEGRYNETESEIQKALLERKERLGLNDSIDMNLSKPSVPVTNFDKIRTAEMYFGYGFSRGQLGNIEGYKPGSIVNYTLPESYSEDKFYLGGEWLNNEDNMESVKNSEIVLNYNSRQINIVAGSTNPVELGVYVDGIFVGNVSVNESDLYTLYSAADYGEHTLKVVVPSGLRAFTFTFG